MTRVALRGCGWIQMPREPGVLAHAQGELATLDRQHPTRDRTVDASARQASA
jgi:hypothetical protein